MWKLGSWCPTVLKVGDQYHAQDAADDLRQVRRRAISVARGSVVAVVIVYILEHARLRYLAAQTFGTLSASFCYNAAQNVAAALADHRMMSGTLKPDSYRSGDSSIRDTAQISHSSLYVRVHGLSGIGTDE